MTPELYAAYMASMTGTITIAEAGVIGVGYGLLIIFFILFVEYGADLIEWIIAQLFKLIDFIHRLLN